MRKATLIFAVIVIVSLVFLTTALGSEVGSPSNANAQQKMIATIASVVAGGLFLGVCILLAMREGSALFASRGTTWPILLLAALVAVAMRVIVALMFEGYATDIGCFKGWAIAAYEQGPANFYTSGMFADYPPGYMYILYVIGWLREVFAIDYGSAAFTLLIKIPSFIAEVAMAIIIYRVGKKQIGKMFGLLAASLVLFNPAMLFNSAAWGQIDAVFILFVVLALLYLKKENYLLGALFFTIALLIKPQAIMFAPIVGLAYVYALFKRGGMKKALVGIFGGAAIFAALMTLAAWPFTGSQQPLWIFEKYANTVNFYPYTSLNAFNLFALIGGNFQSAEQPFLGLDFATWGWILIAVVCVAVVLLQWRSRERRPLFGLGAFLIVSVFMLSHAMHERYILPAGILLIFAYVYSRNNKTLLFAALFTIFGLASQMVTLFAPSTAVDETTTLVMSIIGIALYIVYAIATIRDIISGKVLIKSPAAHS